MNQENFRLGRFRLRRGSMTIWEQWLGLFSNVVVVDVVHHWDTDTTEYCGFSKQFEEVQQGCTPPWYRWIGTKEGWYAQKVIELGEVGDKDSKWWEEGQWLVI